MTHLVVIGGSDAGISAALRAREVDPSWDVTLFCADAFPNFSICGLPFYLSGETPRWESLAHRTRADIESRGIELWLDCVAERIDPVARRVSVTTADRRLQSLSYDRLVIATGAMPAPPPIDGLDTPGVYSLHTMAESFAVHEHLESRQPRGAVIVGGGYIGVEMADALRHRGLQVTLLEAGSSVLQTIDPEFGARIREELAGHEVDVRTSAAVRSVERAGPLFSFAPPASTPCRLISCWSSRGSAPMWRWVCPRASTRESAGRCACRGAWRPISRMSSPRVTALRRTTA